MRALIPASLPPGSVMGVTGPQASNPSLQGSQGRIYEWQETALPIDTARHTTDTDTSILNGSSLQCDYIEAKRFFIFCE